MAVAHDGGQLSSEDSALLARAQIALDAARTRP